MTNKNHESGRPQTAAFIDLSAVADNCRAVRERLQGDCLMMAIVKADGYGHGAVPVARVLRDCGASWFGVARASEAYELREGGVTEPILVLGYTPVGEAEKLARGNITQAVISVEYGMALSEAALRAGVRLPVHIKIDTGMTRLGIPGAERDAGIDGVEAVCRLPGLEPEGVFTHFASADEADEADEVDEVDEAEAGEAYTRLQFRRFRDILDGLESRNIRFRYRHCCNSAATLRFPEMHLDMVRPGLVLYGLYPELWMKSLLGLRPAMSLRSEIVAVQHVPQGTPVSYGRTYTAARASDLAIVPVGYADGYPRCISDKGHVLVNGRKAPIAGRICMDMCAVDVTGIENAGPGTPVTLFGMDGGVALPVEILAEWSYTINYERVCDIGKRIPRVYAG